LFSAQASGQMFSLAPEVTKAKSAARIIFALHDQKPTIEDDSLAEIDSALATKSSGPGAGKGSVELRDVFFAYPSRPETNVLSGLDLTITANEFVAIVSTAIDHRCTNLILIPMVKGWGEWGWKIIYHIPYRAFL